MKTALIIIGILIILYFLMLWFNIRTFKYRIKRIANATNNIEIQLYLEKLIKTDHKKLRTEIERLEREHNLNRK